MTKYLPLILGILLVLSSCHAQEDPEISPELAEFIFVPPIRPELVDSTRLACVRLDDFRLRLAGIVSNSLEFAPDKLIQGDFLLSAATIARTATYSCLHIYDILSIALMADNTDVNDFVKTYLPKLIGEYKFWSEGDIRKLKLILELEMPQSADDAVQDLLEHLENYLTLLDVLVLEYK